MLCKATGPLHLFSHSMNFGCSGCQAANLSCVLLHSAQPKARSPGFPPIQEVPWYSWGGDPWPGPAAPHYHGIVCDGISVHFTALAAGKQISDGSSFPLLLSQSQTFIFNLRFGALAVRLEVIIAINRRYASSEFKYKVLYLGKPVGFL